MVGRSGGGGVATVNTGGQGGGEEGRVGIKRGGSCPEEREGVWRAGDEGETSGGDSTAGADKLASGPRSGSAWGSRDLQGLRFLVPSDVGCSHSRNLTIMLYMIYFMQLNFIESTYCISVEF